MSHTNGTLPKTPIIMEEGNGTATQGAHLFPNRREYLANRVFMALMGQHGRGGFPSGMPRSMPGDGAMTGNRDLASLPWGPRRGLFEGGGHQRIDIDAECGYPDETEMDATWYKKAYENSGLATRCVNVWADECWNQTYNISESSAIEGTPFEQSVQAVEDKTLLSSYLHRLDRVSGIGQFGVMLLGYDDGAPLSVPPVGIDAKTGKRIDGAFKPMKLNYVRTYDQTLCRVAKTDKDIYSERNGQPTHYQIQFNSPAILGTQGAGIPPGSGPSPSSGPGVPFYWNYVHWTRIQHFADNPISSEVFGGPRLQKVAKYLHDVRKVAGGAGEMFWRGGFPGLAFETFPDMLGESSIDVDSLRDEIWAYQQGMQRYLATVGGSWKSLSPQVADPSHHLEWYLKLICISLEVPLTIFMGAQTGHLASTKEDDNWRTRIVGRQTKVLKPKLVRPLFNRLIEFGCVKPPKKKDDYGNPIYQIGWRDNRTMSEKEAIDIALKKTQAIAQFVSQNADQRYPWRMFLTQVLNMTEEQATAVMTELEKNPPKPPIAPAGSGAGAGGQRNGAVPRAPVGKPKNSGPEGTPKNKPAGAQRRRPSYR